MLGAIKVDEFWQDVVKYFAGAAVIIGGLWRVGTGIWKVSSNVTEITKNQEKTIHAMENLATAFENQRLTDDARMRNLEDRVTHIEARR